MLVCLVQTFCLSRLTLIGGGERVERFLMVGEQRGRRLKGFYTLCSVYLNLFEAIAVVKTCPNRVERNECVIVHTSTLHLGTPVFD